VPSGKKGHAGEKPRVRGPKPEIIASQGKMGGKNVLYRWQMKATD
jgi:hypothetical protein